MKPTPKRSIFNIETLLIILIAFCVVFLNGYTTNKIQELESSANGAMFVMDEMDYSESDVLAEEISEYRPGSCKMIEMYNENLELIFALQFNEYHPIHDNNIIAHPDLVKLLTEDREGQTTIETDEYKEHIHFQWVSNDHGDERLVIVYSSVNIVKYLWVFQLICYLILILVFVLLIRLHLIDYRRTVKRYEITTKNVEHELRGR